MVEVLVSDLKSRFPEVIQVLKAVASMKDKENASSNAGGKKWTLAALNDMVNFWKMWPLHLQELEDLQGVLTRAEELVKEAEGIFIKDRLCKLAKSTK